MTITDYDRKLLIKEHLGLSEESIEQVGLSLLYTLAMVSMGAGQIPDTISFNFDSRSRIFEIKKYIKDKNEQHN